MLGLWARLRLTRCILGAGALPNGEKIANLHIAKQNEEIGSARERGQSRECLPILFVFIDEDYSYDCNHFGRRNSFDGAKQWV